jgi:hypothetical protein
VQHATLRMTAFLAEIELAVPRHFAFVEMQSKIDKFSVS